MRLIESRDIGPFSYTRSELKSDYLGKTVTLGKLIPRNLRTPSATIYLLHGGNGDDQQPVQVGLADLINGTLLERFSEKGIQLVFPYVGTSFLHDSLTAKNRAYSSYFLHEVLAKAEHGTTTEPSRRFITGFSIGGAAALNFFFRHPALFSGVGVHFATLTGFDYLNEHQVAAFFARTGIDSAHLKILIDEYTSEFADLQDFQRHDPVTLASSLSPEILRSKRIYFDCGSEDDYGLFEGADLLDELLQKRGIAHQYEKVEKGRHDAPFLQNRLPLMLSHLVGSIEQC